jgi:hypothetical protein
VFLSSPPPYTWGRKQYYTPSSEPFRIYPNNRLENIFYLPLFNSIYKKIFLGCKILQGHLPPLDLPSYAYGEVDVVKTFQRLTEHFGALELHLQVIQGVTYRTAEMHCCCFGGQLLALLDMLLVMQVALLFSSGNQRL